MIVMDIRNVSVHLMTIRQDNCVTMTFSRIDFISDFKSLCVFGSVDDFEVPCVSSAILWSAPLG